MPRVASSLCMAVQVDCCCCWRCCCCRMVLTDHGRFVLINVYVPNAGDPPARPRLPFKLRFLRALKRRMDELTLQGRQAGAGGSWRCGAAKDCIAAVVTGVRGGWTMGI